ncbi:MAG: hypothetical protein JRI46_11960 [Deltaproteobacteria bacterium]|nr:hypothetical protein [Deltaproteobacteria bacterium]
MQRLPASKKLRKELESLLGGIDSGKFLVSEVMKKGATIILVLSLFYNTFLTKKLKTPKDKR